MSFIDDGIAQRELAKRRSDLLAEHGPRIYADLWDHVKGYVEEAKQKGFSLFTNGSLYDRVVEIQIMPAGAAVSHRDKFTIRLDLPGQSIRAKGQREVDFEFKLEICPGDIVCLTGPAGTISYALVSRFGLLFGGRPRFRGTFAV